MLMNGLEVEKENNTGGKGEAFLFRLKEGIRFCGILSSTAHDDHRSLTIRDDYGQTRNTENYSAQTDSRSKRPGGRRLPSTSTSKISTLNPDRIITEEVAEFDSSSIAIMGKRVCYDSCRVTLRSIGHKELHGHGVFPLTPTATSLPVDFLSPHKKPNNLNSPCG